MLQLKDLILKTKKVNWQELKDLQPNNLKTPYHSNLTKESLIKNGFAFSFYIWEDKNGDKYLVDGHLRTDLLRELKNDGYDIPEQLSCTFLDLPNRKTAVKYLLEVFNTKKNPIDEATMIDWIKDEDIDLEDVNLDWVDVANVEILDIKELDELEPNMEEAKEQLSYNDSEKVPFRFGEIKFDVSHEFYESWRNQLMDQNITTKKEITIWLQKQLRLDQFNS